MEDTEKSLVINDVQGHFCWKCATIHSYFHVVLVIDSRTFFSHLKHLYRFVVILIIFVCYRKQAHFFSVLFRCIEMFLRLIDSCNHQTIIRCHLCRLYQCDHDFYDHVRNRCYFKVYILSLAVKCDKEPILPTETLIF